jgi:hypothetical protein
LENKNIILVMLSDLQRGVAQFGSALRSGRRGRRFKSGHPDQFSLTINSRKSTLVESGVRPDYSADFSNQ